MPVYFPTRARPVLLAVALLLASGLATGAAVADTEAGTWQRVHVKRAGVSFDVPADWTIDRSRVPETGLVLVAKSPATPEGVAAAAIAVFVHPDLAGLVASRSDAKDLADGTVYETDAMRLGKTRVFVVDSREVDSGTTIGRVEFAHRILLFDHADDQVTIRMLADSDRYAAPNELRKHLVESLRSL